VRYAQTADGVKHIFILEPDNQNDDSTDLNASNPLTNDEARRTLSDAAPLPKH
jgi:hypothetical protein